MESTTVKLYSLNYGNVRTYLAASLFIVGNILFPQFFHLIPQGGITWLPIYFFTLIGAYKYGWKVGLLTAVLSPIINSSLFGMPMPVVLPAARSVKLVPFMASTPPAKPTAKPGRSAMDMAMKPARMGSI